MILKNQKTQNSKDWTNYYKAATCLKVGINPELPLVVCGYEPEPQCAWNPKTNKYDGVVNAYGYWVNQCVKDSNGNLWLQNPVMVIVDGGEPFDFKFGQKVKFHNLGGYYSRKKYQYLFRAKGISSL